MQSIMNLMNSNEGRSLETLIKSTEALKGAESQRLRTYFSTNCMEPARDLDTYGKLLVQADLASLKANFAQRVTDAMAAGKAHSAAVDQLITLRWGPTQVPIFNCLLASVIWHGRRTKILGVVRWLISIGLPVDGTDLSGTTALAHALSTKPTYDPEFGQILLDAGGNINARNRYGGTCAHEFSMVWTPDPAAVSRAKEALCFFLAHGGNVDIMDNDGVTARGNFSGCLWLSDLVKIARAEDARRVNACIFCGRASENGAQLMRCGRCKTVKYCAPPRVCQRGDWARHKRACKA